MLKMHRLPIKAAGGVRTYAEAEMISLGVKRVGIRARQSTEQMQNQNIKITVSMKKSLLTLFLVGLVLLYKVKVQILVCQLSDFLFWRL
jgi:hypothetical protein